MRRILFCILLACGCAPPEPEPKGKKEKKEKPPAPVAKLAIGAPAPEVVSKDLAGKEVRLSSYKGKVVVLDIWATWCPPCRAMIPHERELVARLAGKPFALISVSGDNTPEILKEFLTTNPMPWTHWHEGPRGAMLVDWKVEYFPTIYVLDRKGIIRYKDVRGQEMDDAVDKLLSEKP